MQPLTEVDGPLGAVHHGAWQPTFSEEDCRLAQVGAQGTFAAIVEGSGQQLAQSRGSSAAQTPGPLMWLTFALSLLGTQKATYTLDGPWLILKQTLVAHSRRVQNPFNLY